MEIVGLLLKATCGTAVTQPVRNEDAPTKAFAYWGSCHEVTEGGAKR